VSFATKAARVSAITSSARELDDSVASLEIHRVDGLGSALGDGLALAVDEFRGSSAERKVVILFSDGEWNSKNQYDPEQASALAKAQRIEVYTVHVASTVESCSKAELTLKLISATTNGAYYRADDLGSFSGGLQAIHGALDARTSR
jgi:Mg-chelatase subunit ChlD